VAPLHRLWSNGSRASAGGLRAATQRQAIVMGGPWAERKKKSERLRRMNPRAQKVTVTMIEDEVVRRKDLRARERTPRAAWEKERASRWRRELDRRAA
jgi:hypothetical protein